MPINIAPPSPPPFQRMTADHNPYEFITNPANPARRTSGGSQKQRILFVAIGGGLLLIIASIVINIIGGSGNGLKDDYLSVLQQQTELIRISDIGVTKARQADAKNLAITTHYSLMSEQANLIKLAKKAGANTNPKLLVLTQNAQTDQLFTQADQSNHFDDTFTTTIKQSLQKYKQQLQQIYNATVSQSSRSILHDDLANAALLIGTQPNTNATSETPATNL